MVVPLGDDQPVRQTLIRGADRPEGERGAWAAALIAVPHPNLIGQHGGGWSVGAKACAPNSTLPGLAGRVVRYAKDSPA